MRVSRAYVRARVCMWRATAGQFTVGFGSVRGVSKERAQELMVEAGGDVSAALEAFTESLRYVRLCVRLCGWVSGSMCMCMCMWRFDETDVEEMKAKRINHIICVWSAWHTHTLSLSHSLVCVYVCARVLCCVGVRLCRDWCSMKAARVTRKRRALGCFRHCVVYARRLRLVHELLVRNTQIHTHTRKLAQEVKYYVHV